MCYNVIVRENKVIGGYIVKVKRCDMCFQDKAGLSSVLPGMPTVVCKACAFKVNQVLGFIAYYGGTISYQPELAVEHQETTKPKKGATKDPE